MMRSLPVVLLLLPLLLLLLTTTTTNAFVATPRRSSYNSFSLDYIKNNKIHTNSKDGRIFPTTTTTTTTTAYSKTTTARPALLDALNLVVANEGGGVLTNDNIKTAVSVATFFPQPFWTLLVFLPNTKFTKKLMGGMEIVTLCCLVHFFIVVASIAQPNGSAPIAEFSLVFDPAGDSQAGMVNMMRYPNFVSEEWSHVLTWDLFVGRWIWLDGLRRNIFTPHSVLLCNFIGPPGLLLHWITCAVTGKGILIENEATDILEQDEEE